MAEERDDPVPTEDPRRTGVSEQNAEEGPHPDAGPGSAEPATAGLRQTRRTPRTMTRASPEQATGNPKAG